MSRGEQKMNVGQLIAGLDSEIERNTSLDFLASLVVDTDDGLLECLAGIIKQPSSIENSNRFARLLEALGSDALIPALIEVISKGSPETSPWLADYMYALGSLMNESEEYWPAEEDFVRTLGDWLLSTGGGEISWKAGIILAEIKHPSSRDYLLEGAADQSLFHQTRISCIRAIVNQYPEDALAILEQFSTDPQSYVREAAVKQKHWMKWKALQRDSAESSC
jgi:HEAT repeat protein